MKPDLPAPPWWSRLYWRAWGWYHWPADVRMMKREGWHKTGWRTWEGP
jgi:hypothetical protein